ncbi:MAG: hypothetical protein ACWGQW_03400 [bacterium]
MVIQEYLQTVSRMTVSNAEEPLTYYGIEDALLKCGRGFSVAPLPEHIERGEVKQCFRNAYQIAIEHDLIYCEGLAVSSVLPFPVLHAWVFDGRHFIYETTWPELGQEYWGVALSTTYVEKELLRREVYGILDMNIELFKNGFPEGAIL